jgi:ribonucleoside-diphosphate reductase alpha chain
LKQDELERIEAQLPAAFEMSFAFSVYNLGEEALKRLGIRPEVYTKPGFNLLQELGFTPAQIDAANEYVCGTMTVEGAPFLKREHYSVFDCANKCGVKGKRFIHAHAHIRMMAAAQSFISGAISKTINLPNEATWQEIEECHKMSWQLGLKAISIYRDGSKLSQPLSASSDKKDKAEAEAEEKTQVVNEVEAGLAPLYLNDKQLVEILKQRLKEDSTGVLQNAVRQLVSRRELPTKRRGYTTKAKVGGQTIFVRTGEYNDGNVGEIFIDIHKEGATLRSIMNCFAIAVSIGLQYGVPLEEYVDKFVFTRFEPAGPVDHPNIKSATSLIDFIFRLLGSDYLGRTDLLHVQPTEQTAARGSNLGGAAFPLSEEMRPLQLAEILGKDSPVVPQEVAEANPLTADSVVAETSVATVGAQGAQQFLSNMMGDAPACNVCGHITIRNGTCYKCLNCGNSMGCS